jgi:hypothetical protein
MRARLFAVFVLFSALASAQTAKQSGIQACSLITKADVERVTGQKQFSDPTPIGSGCGFDNAQVLIYSSETAWESTMKIFGQDKAARTPITGLGDKAYSFNSTPRTKNEDANAFVVVTKSMYTIAVSVAAPEGKSPASVQPQALELAKIVLGKLK